MNCYDAVMPVDAIKVKRGNLTGAQTKPGKQQQDRIIALALGSLLAAIVQNEVYQCR